MPDTINVRPLLKPAPELSFTTSPQAAVFAWTSGSDTYTTAAHKTALNTSITFTATVVTYDPDQQVVGYEWDFGDGNKGFGSPVAHTYTVAMPTTQAVLTVIDNFGRRFHARKQMYF